MAVYKRSYKSYTGPITAEWSRFWIIPRFAWDGLFQQRLLTILYVVCFFYPLGAAMVIYFNSNMSFLRQYIPVPDKLIDIGNDETAMKPATKAKKSGNSAPTP